MSKISTQIDLALRLKRIKQVDLAKHLEMDRSNLSKFLAGETDIRSSILVGTLKALGVNLEAILENELEVLMGNAPKRMNLGSALEVLLREKDQFSALRVLDASVKEFDLKAEPGSEVAEALEVVNEHRMKLKTVLKPIRSLA